MSCLMPVNDELVRVVRFKLTITADRHVRWLALG